MTGPSEAGPSEAGPNEPEPSAPGPSNDSPRDAKPAADGIRISNRVPRDGSLCAEMMPSCSDTMRWTTLSPRSAAGTAPDPRGE
ncbi:MAG: hypothetical protein NTU45_14075 [Planctomycetota bacterium]|nr:hypothetical protein [Planctomycetota bacterium]